MLAAIVISSFIIIILTFAIQVPVFSWFYKSLIKDIHIDYLYTSFWFLVTQLIISVILITCNYFIQLEDILANTTWYNNSINILVNITIGVIVNLVFIGILVVTLNKLVFKLKIWDNFFINFVLLLLLMVFVPLLVFLYSTMFQPNNIGV